MTEQERQAQNDGARTTRMVPHAITPCPRTATVSQTIDGASPEPISEVIAKQQGPMIRPPPCSYKSEAVMWDAPTLTDDTQVLAFPPGFARGERWQCGARYELQAD